MKKIITTILTCVCLCTLTACGSGDSGDNADNSVKETISESKDDEGNSNMSILSLAPSFTEILVDLGLKDNIIGADFHSIADWTLDDNVAVFDMMALDPELVVSLEPDIIFMSDISMGGGESPLAPINNFGIEIIVAPTCNSVDEIYEYITYISQCVGEEEKGLQIVAELKEELQNIEEIASNIDEDSKKTVYFEISPVPYIYTFGNGVYLNEMIEIVGGINVLAHENDWFPMEEESAINLNPDFIFTNVNYLDNSVQEILDRVGWEEVEAIKNEDVYYIDNSSSSYGNHNIIVAMKEMAEILYPDYYEFN